MEFMRGINRLLLSSLLILCFSSAYAYQQIDFVREIGASGKEADQRQFNEPRGFAATADRLYVADTESHRILILDLSGKTLRSFGKKGSKAGEFKRPSALAVDEQGKLYVADTGNHHVQVFDAEGKWIRSIGEKGDGARQFNSPSGVAVRKGLIYVADTGNSRIQVLTADGIFMRQITFKANKEQMESPASVAVDEQNMVYVLDSSANNVRIFDSTGTQTRMFGVQGNALEGFEKPRGIAVDVRGIIYVADTGNFKIKKFTPEGKLIGSLGSEGDGRGQFREVVGVLVDADRKIWALDASKGTIQVFTSERDDKPTLPSAAALPSIEVQKIVPGETASLAINKRLWGLAGDSLVALGIAGGGRTISSTGTEPGFLKNPRGMAVDSQGNFWVADTGNDRIQKFSLEGTLLQVIGKSGSNEGEFRSPSGVAVTLKGNICVIDTGNNRVQVFSPKGVFLGAFGKPGKADGQFEDIADIDVDSSENIYVVDRGNNRITKTDSNGAILWEKGNAGSQQGEFFKPNSILVSPDNEVYVLDSGNSRVQVFDNNGKFLRMFGSEGTDPGSFKSPQALGMEEGRRLYVGDRGNKRVQIFLLKFTPETPKDVAAQPKVNEVQLSWKPLTESYVQQYQVYRSETGKESFARVGAATTPFYLDKNLPSNHTYHYRVSALAKEGNESTLSGTVSATTPKLVPTQPKKVRLEPSEKHMTLSWLPNHEPFVTHYHVYRSKQPAAGFELASKTDKTILVDGPLTDDTLYYYQITAIGKEGDESQPSETIFASTPKAPQTVPPLEIGNIQLGEVFAAAYKYYESHPLGKVVITNNTVRTYSKLKVSFSIKDFMDFPTELEIATLGPKQSIQLDLKPVFSNKILEVTENTPLQSEIALTYHVAGEPKTILRNFPVMLYEKHAIRWDDKKKIGSFVTPKDPLIHDFTRAVVQQYVDTFPNLDKNIVYARALYDALGVMGLTYIVDPTPFQQFSGNSNIVDYTLYPRDVLLQKSGDCDGLSLLLAAALENISIETALVDVPGHVFLLFNTGVPEAERKNLGFPDELLVLHQGFTWIPVEMTMVGSSFTQAWRKGAEEYHDWSAKKKVEIISVHKAWEQFKPVTLQPYNDIGPGKAKSEEIEAKYKGELEELARTRLANLSAGYREILKKNPQDLQALGQLGILYGENGLTAEALEEFHKMLALDKTNALALNNVGNISFLQGRFEEARQAYEAALKSTPKEPGVMINLARVLLQLSKKEAAKKLFREAAEVDPRVVRQYPDLAASLGMK